MTTRSSVGHIRKLVYQGGAEEAWNNSIVLYYTLEVRHGEISVRYCSIVECSRTAMYNISPQANYHT